MKIALASDHRGYKLKEKIKQYLIKNKIEVLDCGTTSNESVDFPIYAHKLGESLQKNQADLGIAICGTGIGMSIALNKMKNITCAKVSNPKEAMFSRLHNNANVLALSEDISWFKTKQIITIFLTTELSPEEKYTRRIKEIEEYQND